MKSRHKTKWNVKLTSSDANTCFDINLTPTEARLLKQVAELSTMAATDHWNPVMEIRKMKKRRGVKSLEKSHLYHARHGATFAYVWFTMPKWAYLAIRNPINKAMKPAE